MRRAILLAAVAALVLVGFVPAAGADPASRPFQAVLTGTLTFVLDPDCPAFGLRTDVAAIGTASHLGLSAITNSHCTSVAEYAGTGTLVAANGDELFFNYEGVAPPLPTTIGELEVITGDYQIVGGTGRFEDAVGGWHMTLYVVFEGVGVPVWPMTMFLKGAIGF